MHDDEPCAGVGDQGGHLGVQQPADVVDDGGSGREDGLDHGRAVGVDRDHHVGIGRVEGGDHRHDAGDLLVDGHLGDAGDARLATDVDHDGALGDLLERQRHPLVGRAVLAAVGERVGRGVHDAHERGLGEVEVAAAHGQPGRGVHGEPAYGCEPAGPIPPPDLVALATRSAKKTREWGGSRPRAGAGQVGGAAAQPGAPAVGTVGRGRRRGWRGRQQVGQRGQRRQLAERPRQRRAPGPDERGRVLVADPRPVERGLQHDERLGAEVVEVAVPVDARAEVDLRHRLHAHQVGDVDEHAGLDAVAPHERQALEQLAAPPVLAGQRLDDRRQVGEQRGDERPGHQLGRAPAADAAGAGPLVEALHEADVGVGEQRTQQPDDEAGRDVGDVGVAPQDDVALRHVHRAPQRLALAAAACDLGEDARRPTRRAPRPRPPRSTCRRSSGRR